VTYWIINSSLFVCVYCCVYVRWVAYMYTCMCCVILGFWPCRPTQQEVTINTTLKEVTLHWNLTWEWGLDSDAWAYLCHVSSPWQYGWIHRGENKLSGKTIGWGITVLQFCQEEDILICLCGGYTRLIWIFVAQSLAPICTLYGIPCTILHILMNCPHCDKEHLTFQLHDMLCNILGDEYHNVYNILTLVTSVSIVKFISLAEFYVFIVIPETISFYSYSYFMTLSIASYTAWQTIPF
jgi:hypothetical protein